MIRWTAILWLTSMLAASTAFAAEDFSPITDAERALTEVSGQPGAPAVVLHEKAELKMMDYGREASSYLKVDVRLKILTEEGKSFGEVEIPHSGFHRLKNVEGRTVLPDGREIPLPEDAIFEEQRSRSLKSFVTKLAFPAVEVGAILDYRYTIRWDDLHYLQPWYFNSRVPTLLSEIVYIKPDNLGLVPWAVQHPAYPIRTEVQKTTQGTTVRAWSESLPAIPEEPYSFPFSALANRFMMIPKVIQYGGSKIPLMDTWRSTCEYYVDLYKLARRRDGKARKHALQLAAGESSRLDKIAAVHGFVRDEVRTSVMLGVGLVEDEHVDKAFAERRGSGMVKALMLQSMLDALKVGSDLVWVADRTIDRVDLGVANPWWFDSALVRVEIDGRPIYLDPVDRSAGFDHVSPYYEGTPALVYHSKKPETIELPVRPHDENLRRARIELEVDGDGRVSGHGSLELGGQQAWRFLRWKDDPESTAEAWNEYLTRRYPGYEITEVEVEEEIRRQRAEVRWSLVQREEEVLGDEVTLAPARPLGRGQLFTLPPESRKTPVQLLFGLRDETLWTLAYPQGWVIDALPASESFHGEVGTIEVQVEPDEAAGKITVRRRFERPGRDFIGVDSYRMLRDLYAQAAKADAQSVVLVQP